MTDFIRVRFEGDSLQLLDDLAQMRGSRAEVLRSALALERAYQDAIKRGAFMATIKDDGSVNRLVRR